MRRCTTCRSLSWGHATLVTLLLLLLPPVIGYPTMACLVQERCYQDRDCEVGTCTASTSPGIKYCHPQ